MIIGNGMLASAFKAAASINDSACLFASGVSNSRCNDLREFTREADLLQKALAEYADAGVFIYFGTCSVYDPASQLQPYVLHKLEMEKMVLQHPAGLVVRLPQVAGRCASPNTLLAALCDSIRMGQTINVWEHAMRNIVDVVDVVKIVSSWLAMKNQNAKVINVANPVSYPIVAIIESIESVLGFKAKLNFMNAGAAYKIDISIIEPLIQKLSIDFGKDYLPRVIARYYL